jgi:ribonuclease HII
LPPDQPGLAGSLSGLRDSKQMTPAQREQFFPRIHQSALAVGVGLALPELLDKINVVGATRYAMQQALANLAFWPDFLLLDHLRLPAVNLPQDAFPKAENISLSVAAAAVIAKVTRDRLMVELSQQYPLYGFDRHKGYGTAAHRAALVQHGPCPLHRLSYKPLTLLKSGVLS